MLPLLAALALLQPTPQQPQPQPQEEPAQAPATEVQDDGHVTTEAATTPPPPAPAPPQVQAPAPVPVDEAPAYAPQAYAAQGMSDRRIQTLPYSPDQIVTLSVSPGFASVVELGEDERAENVVVGNSAGWQVTANRRGDRIIVKPLGGASASNLIVLTGSRRYIFLLDPFGDSSFILRFSYPQPVQSAAAIASAGVMPTGPGYKFRGSKSLFPLAMSDDGRRTVIRFAEHSPLPAIFAVNGRRNESLVNGRMIGNDYVIEGAAPRYKFRYGKAEAIAIRQTPRRRR